MLKRFCRFDPYMKVYQIVMVFVIACNPVVTPNGNEKPPGVNPVNDKADVTSGKNTVIEKCLSGLEMHAENNQNIRNEFHPAELFSFCVVLKLTGWSGPDDRTNADGFDFFRKYLIRNSGPHSGKFLVVHYLGPLPDTHPFYATMKAPVGSVAIIRISKSVFDKTPVDDDGYVDVDLSDLYDVELINDSKS